MNSAVPITRKVVSELDRARVIVRTGDHTIFVGEILAAYISEEKKKVLFNLGNDRFGGF